MDNVVVCWGSQKRLWIIACYCFSPRHQGFGVLSVILANHAIKLLTSLFQDLQVEALHRVNKMTGGTLNRVLWVRPNSSLPLRVGRVMVHQRSSTSWHRAPPSRGSSGSSTLCPWQTSSSLFFPRPTKRSLTEVYLKPLLLFLMKDETRCTNIII